MITASIPGFNAEGAIYRGRKIFRSETLVNTYAHETVIPQLRPGGTFGGRNLSAMSGCDEECLLYYHGCLASCKDDSCRAYCMFQHDNCLHSCGPSRGL